MYIGNIIIYIIIYTYSIPPRCWAHDTRSPWLTQQIVIEVEYLPLSWCDNNVMQVRFAAAEWTAYNTGRGRDGRRNGQAAAAVILYKTATGHDDDAAAAAARNDEPAAPTDPTHPRAFRRRSLVPSVPPHRRSTNRRRAAGASARRPSPLPPLNPADAFADNTTPTPPSGEKLPPTTAGAAPSCPPPRRPWTVSYYTLVRVTYPLFPSAALPARRTTVQHALKMARIFLFPLHYYYSLLHFTRYDITMMMMMIIIIRRWRIADDNRIYYII